MTQKEETSQSNEKFGTVRVRLCRARGCKWYDIDVDKYLKQQKPKHIEELFTAI